MPGSDRVRAADDRVRVGAGPHADIARGGAAARATPVRRYRACHTPAFDATGCLRGGSGGGGAPARAVNIAVFHNLPSGGAKRVLHGLVRHWSHLGCAVDVFTVSTADEVFLDLRPLARTVTVEPVRITVRGAVRSTLRYLPPAIPYRISLGDLEAAQRRVAGMINAGNFDVVFVEQDVYTVSPFVLPFLATPNVYYCQQPSRLQEVAAFHRRGPGVTRFARALVERYA